MTGSWPTTATSHAPAGDFVLDGVTVSHLVRPVGRAGLYAPGGLARYPSTVLMCAAPARVAGVDELVLCVPPGPDGQVATETLAAAAIAGIDEVYAIGGAQAVAAMAYGTETIRPVDVIVGPGNRYVAEAKRQVAGVVGGPFGLRRAVGGGGGGRRDHARGLGGHRPRGPGRARPRRAGLARHLVGSPGRGGGRGRRGAGDALAPAGRARGHLGLGRVRRAGRRARRGHGGGQRGGARAPGAAG